MSPTKKHFNYKSIVENESNPKKRKDKPNDSFKVSLILCSNIN